MPNPDIDKIIDKDANETYPIKNTNTWRGVKYQPDAYSNVQTLLDTQAPPPEGNYIIFVAGDNVSLSPGPALPGGQSTALIIHANDTKPTGYDKSGDKTDNVSNSASWSILSSVAITKGKWLVNYGANFPSLGSGNTGHCGVGVSASSTATTAPPVYLRQTAQRITQDNYTTLSGAGVYDCTTDTATLYLKVRQTSGQTLSVEGRLHVIKID